MILDQIQKLIKDIDGWLIYDFQGRNYPAIEILNLKEKPKRRFFYWIPSIGIPVQIVHSVETHLFDLLPGEKWVYSSQNSLDILIKSLLNGKSKVAMEFSDNGRIPAISFVDGGTLDWIRGFGVQVISSCRILQEMNSVLTKEQIISHQRAAKFLESSYEKIWGWIKIGIEELEIQHLLVDWFKENKFIHEGDPIIAFGENSSDPHHRTGARKLQAGDLILVDIWAKEERQNAIYADLCKVAMIGKPKFNYEEIFQLVREAQQIGIEEVKPFHEGYKLDEKVRAFFNAHDVGPYFTHRLGHSIETQLHGRGADLDSYEKVDNRQLLPGTCMSIEPGLYFKNQFGIRLESDVIIGLDQSVLVTGGVQDKVVEL
jgi:Xaa-Pro dipeptidase